MTDDKRAYEWGVADDRATMAIAMAMRDPNPIHHGFEGAPMAPPIVQGPVIWSAALEAAAAWFPDASLRSASARFLAPVRVGEILVAHQVNLGGSAQTDAIPGTVEYEVRTAYSEQPVVTGALEFQSLTRRERGGRER